MKRNNFLLLTILLSALVILGIGTYAYFTADIVGNVDEDNIIQSTGTLKIEYVEGQNVIADKVRPGYKAIKTFTVKNTGTLPVNYDIQFTDIENTFINDEIIFRGSCASSLATCESLDETIFDVEDFPVKQNVNLQPDEEHSYEIEIEFIETNDNQDYNIQATLSGIISVKESGT